MVVAILAVPYLGKSFCGDAGLVVCPEAVVAAVELSLLCALEAVVIVEVVLVHLFLLLSVGSFLQEGVRDHGVLQFGQTALGLS